MSGTITSTNFARRRCADTLSQLSVICCIDMSFASQSFISFSNGFTNGEPFIVCALMMWSSRISWMSSIVVSIDTPLHTTHRYTTSHNQPFTSPHSQGPTRQGCISGVYFGGWTPVQNLDPPQKTFYNVFRGRSILTTLPRKIPLTL